MGVLVKICIAVAPMARARAGAWMTPPAVETWAPSSVAGAGTGRYGSLAYLIDLENVEYRPLRPTQYLPNVQANDADEFAGEFKTEFSFRLARESTHAKLTDVLG